MEGKFEKECARMHKNVHEGKNPRRQSVQLASTSGTDILPAETKGIKYLPVME
jgi:hypothetical protein